MQANVGRSTSIEIRLSRVIAQAGFDFRTNEPVAPDVRVKADIVFREQKVCVFVDGCFWHGCKRHFRLPKTNAEWWNEKIEDNRRRDRKKTRLLKKHGWIVIRLWEHDLGQESITKAAGIVIGAVSNAAANGP